MIVFPNCYKCSNDITTYDYLKSGKKLKKYKPDDKFVDIDLTDQNVILNGNVKFAFFDHDAFGKDTKMCHLWFNTKFIDNNYLGFEKSVIDKALKDAKCKHFKSDFKIEFFMVEASDLEFDVKITTALEGGGDDGHISTEDDDEN